MSLNERAKRLSDRLAAFDATPEAAAIDLRMDLAELLQDRLVDTGMSQRELGRAAHKSESFISRVMNADANCTFKVVATLLHAVDITPKLVDSNEWNRLVALEKEARRKSPIQVTMIRGKTYGSERYEYWRSPETTRGTGDYEISRSSAHLGGSYTTVATQRYTDRNADIPQYASRRTWNGSRADSVFDKSSETVE